MPPLVSAGLFANETEWRLAAPCFFVLRRLSGIFLLEVLDPINGLKTLRKEKKMKDQRVLIRKGARELTPTETELINGGFRTLSFCTGTPSPDGDQHVGEVGC